MSARKAKADTFTVVNTNDSGPGSLRDAIAQANANPGFDIIEFNIGGGGVQTISPLSPLPPITDRVWINGMSQPGYAGLPLIELDGTNAGPTANGLTILAGGSGSTIIGLAINRFGYNAIYIDGSSDNNIDANHLGTDPSGTSDRGNGQHGVLLANGSTGNTIGASGEGKGNVISGNGFDGIGMLNDCDLNYVYRNLIGTDVTGTAAIPNDQNGIDIRPGCQGNRIGGGLSTGLRNVISGNVLSGIYLEGAEGTVVEGNLIGTDVTGLAGLPNVMDGLMLVSATGSFIGGPGDLRNVISGNSGHGISIEGGGSNRIRYNYIGLGVDGTTPLGNLFEGVLLNSSNANFIGGDRGAGEGNTISANGWSGVRIAGSLSNRVQGNNIGTAESGGGAGLGNGIDGIRLEQGSSNNIIGGDEPGFRNVISANIAAGVRIVWSPGNTIRNNHIGTDISGLFDLGNGSSGVSIEDSESDGNVIGGPQGMGNLISGNNNNGIFIRSASDTMIEGNLIGTVASGTAALPNGGAGIWLEVGSSGNHIGTANEGGGNLISGNWGSGIFLDSSTGNEIIYNRIGTDPEAESGIPNLAGGIHLSDGSDRNTISSNLIGFNGFDGIYVHQSTDCLIGYNGIGDNEQDGVNIEDSPDIGVLFNAIMNNGEVGVSVRGNTSVGVAVVGNRIYNNGGLAMDLMRDGVTPNDGNNNNPAKPNRGYNFPVFDQAEFPVVGGAVQVSGTAPPNAYVEVYYVGPDPDPSGHGEGIDPLANTFADSSGRFSVAVGGLSVGSRISAIAVSPEGDPSSEGNTSEFSANALIISSEKTLGDILWYVAEGSTGGGFETWLLLSNPGEEDTQAYVTLVTESGASLPVAVPVPAGSRVSLRENDYLPEDWSVSAVVRSEAPIVVERSQYWDRGRYGKQGEAGGPQPYEMGAGHANLGTPGSAFRSTSAGGYSYHFAEGATAGGFQTWVLLLNPGEDEAHATVTLMDGDGVAAQVDLTIPPMTRRSVSLGGLLPDSYDVATTVTSDLPLAADRSMYWDPQAAGLPVWRMRGGSSASASPAPATDWFLAEGSTGGGFDTWVLVQNPNDSAATVGLEFVTQEGPAGQLYLDMPANSRSSVRLSDYLPGQYEVSTFVSCEQPVVVERSMYWDMREVTQPCEAREGHSNAGVTRSGELWLVPEGSCGGGFDTFILIANGGEGDARAALTFLTDAGPVGPFDVTVPAGSRTTVRLSDFIPGTFSAATLVRADADVVVERSMYWDMRAAASACEAMGGHCASGLDP